MNVYDKVLVTGEVKEPSFSVSATLERCGDWLLEGRREHCGGRCFAIMLHQDRAVVGQITSTGVLKSKWSLWDRVTSFAGRVLKQLSLLLDSQASTKYQIAAGNTSPEREATLRQRYGKVAPQAVVRDGNDFDWIVPCLACLCFPCLLLQPL